MNYIKLYNSLVEKRMKSNDDQDKKRLDEIRAKVLKRIKKL